MGRAILILAPLLLAGVPFTAQAGTLTLSPGTGWQSEEDSVRCRVSRVFGEGDARHILMIERFSPDDRVTMTLGGPALGDFTDTARAQIDLTDGRDPVWATPVSGAVEGFGSGLKFSGIHLESARLEDAASVTLAQRGRKVRLQTGSLDSAAQTLDACAQRLGSGWGLDMARLQTAASLPQWINRSAIHRRIASSFAENWGTYSPVDGVAQLRVIVNEAGQAEDCVIVPVTSGMAPNDRACRIMQKARFEPARDAQGKPVRAWYTVSFKDRRRNANPWGMAGSD